jgi:hypothetical protein
MSARSRRGSPPASGRGPGEFVTPRRKPAGFCESLAGLLQAAEQATASSLIAPDLPSIRSGRLRPVFAPAAQFLVTFACSVASSAAGLLFRRRAPVDNRKIVFATMRRIGNALLGAPVAKSWNRIHDEAQKRNGGS